MEKYLKNSNNFKLIAEIGWNHMGSLEIAEKMIKAASNSGCTHAKFQNWSVEKLKAGPWDNDGRREIYEKAELTKEKTSKLFDLCDENNIIFLTSIFDESEIEFISTLSKENIKIPSPELRNETLIKNCDKKFKEIILSTGASTIDEIKKSSLLINSANLILLNCVSIYPCPDDKINLKRINKLKKISDNVGISDHSQDTLSSILSFSYDICAIEKHFTIDNNLPGRDNKFALLPKDFKFISDSYIRYLKMISKSASEYYDEEKEIREQYQGRWSKK